MNQAFYNLEKNRLKDLLQKAISKAGSIRKLESQLHIPQTSISDYFHERRLIPELRLQKILLFTKEKLYSSDIKKIEDSNWRQKMGGKRAVELKKLNGTYDSQLYTSQQKGLYYMQTWHQTMRDIYPHWYQEFQKENLKKSGRYKFLTSRGELVRNRLELEMAQLLDHLHIPYIYESKVVIGKQVFFPDFFIEPNILIECTMWRGVEKSLELQRKIEILSPAYRVFVVIPKGLNKYYTILSKHLVKGVEEFVPVAQTFHLNGKGATVEHL